MTSDATSVFMIDCMYLEPEHAAAYLMIEEGRAVFVDNNTVHAVPLLLKALAEHGLSGADVEYIIPTHLHLDHSGGTSLLVKECPNATVLSHPRGIRHFVDPSRLIAGAKAVYGEEAFERLYAPVVPIDESRIRGVGDNETLRFGGRTFTFMHTRGHANHHICIHDSKSNGVFSGDTFGVEYNPFRKTKRPFLVCSSAPTDFDPEAACDSVRRILETGAECVFLAHYGELGDIRAGADVMIESINGLAAIVEEAVASGFEDAGLRSFCETRVRSAFEKLIAFCGASIAEDGHGTMESCIRVNAQGIAYLVDRRRKEAARASQTA